MKKFLLIILFVTTQFSLIAQPLPGKIVLKGSSEFTGFFRSKDYGSYTVKYSSYNLQPALGVFFTHYINVGLYLNYNSSKSTEGADNNSIANYYKESTTAFGPYIRGYIGDSKIIPFIHGNIGYANYKAKQKENSYSDIEEIKLTGVDYCFGIGAEYYVERRFSFEFLLHYSGISVSDKSELYSLNQASIYSAGVGFRVGVSIFLN